MPKLIPDLEVTIIQKARTILFKEGYDALSMRRMANECHIAVGTIYNYVKDKSDLVAKVALTDWFLTVSDIKKNNNNEVDFVKGVINVYKGVKAFNSMYKDYWATISMPGIETQKNLEHFHPQFRLEIQKLILPLMSTDNKIKKDSISKMLAELICSLVIHTDSNEQELIVLLNSIDIK